MSTIEKLKMAVAEKLGVEMDDIGINEVMKNNGIKRTGFAVKCGSESNVAPVTYVDDILEKIETYAIDIDHAADHIVEMLKQNRFNGNIEFNRRMVIDRSFLQIINADSNADLLMNVPHKLVEDLAVVVRVKVAEGSDFAGTTLATYDLLDKFGIGIDEMFTAARDNTLNKTAFRICSLAQMMNELVGDDDYGDDEGSAPYVVTSVEKTYGAVAVAFPDLIGSFVERIGEDVYVLPSSIHEVLLMPKSMTDDVAALKAMVTSINRTEVQQEDVLSNNVYEFCLADKKLKIAV